MNITLFSSITSQEKSNVVEKLITHSTPSQDFYLMMVLAFSMATFGLLLDNVAIIIGSMLISPILYAFLGLSLGFSISDLKLIARSSLSITKAVVAGIAVSTIITLFAPSVGTSNEIFLSINPSLAYGVVAFIAGFAAAFSMTKPQLNETLPGIAIAVSLIPPVAVSGVGLATLQWSVFSAALVLFVLNTIAILAGSLIVFLLMNIYAKKSIASQTLKKEEYKIKEEQDKK